MGVEENDVKRRKSGGAVIAERKLGGELDSGREWRSATASQPARPPERKSLALDA